jgi:hypothetical protein
MRSMCPVGNKGAVDRHARDARDARDAREAVQMTPGGAEASTGRRPALPYRIRKVFYF